MTLRARRLIYHAVSKRFFDINLITTVCSTGCEGFLMIMACAG